MTEVGDLLGEAAGFGGGCRDGISGRRRVGVLHGGRAAERPERLLPPVTEVHGHVADIRRGADPDGERRRQAGGYRVVGPVSVTPVRGLSVTVSSAVLPATFAVTVVSRDVVSWRSRRAAIVGGTDDAESWPPLVEKVTGTPTSAAPDVSSTRAEICVGSAGGAERLRVGVDQDAFGRGAADQEVLDLARGAAGERGDRRRSALAVRDELDADLAVLGPRFAGSIRPSVVVNDTSVPFCTGVPAPGLLVPGVAVVPLPFGGGVWSGGDPVLDHRRDDLGRAVERTLDAVGNSVMTVPDGASSGTLSQAETNERADERRQKGGKSREAADAEAPVLWYHR